ncbi:MAG: ABC transporter permease [Anaeroplasmataceae bacterium]|nr:ABC transporter permease [Anaeroplasmataceae bacterium]MDE6414304.1 ABC transporter permease [Anaeroplasmataceae bacterium]
MRSIGIILKKELKRYFTDVRMLIGIILPGILIFFLYSVMGNFMGNNASSDIKEFSIIVENKPEVLEDIFKAGFEGFEVTYIEEKLTEEEILKKIENQELDLYVSYPKEFLSPSISSIPNVDIYYNSVSDASMTAYTLYTGILNAFEEAQQPNYFDINNRNQKYDLAKEEDITVRIFTMMLPFLLMTFLFSGAMGICSESIAGEKERGTIATLLVTPTKRSHIAIGKVSALGITALASALVSFLGLIASLPKLVGTNLSLSAYNVQTIFMLLVVIILTVLLFTVVLTMVSTFAKSVKEASSLSIPVMILVMLLGATSFMGTTAQTNPALYLIPVYGAIQSLTGILSMTISPLCFAMFILSSIVYIGLGVFGLTKMFNSERIMFNI